MTTPFISGIKYVIHNNNDYIEKILLGGEQWNKEIIDVIKTYISENKLKHFLNVGSHIGTVSLPISLHIDKVTAVEAYPPTYNHLCENIQLNNIQNIEAINIALGNTEEDIYFMGMDKICPIENKNRIANNSGGMHVFTESDIQNNVRSGNLSDKKIKNRMNKFDNLEVDNFDIMLVDIEGFEYNFLLGATEKIKKNKPIIIMEIWNDNKRRSEKMSQPQSEVIDYIKSLNYTLVKSIEDDFIFEPYEPADISFCKNIQKNDKFVTQYLEDITDESLFYMGTMQQNSYDLITFSEFPHLDFETKRDLVRYDTLYNKGGLFADTNVIAFDIDKLYDYDLVLVKGEIFQNNIILSKPGCELFKTMYDLLLKNVQNGVKTDYKRIFHNEVSSFIENKNVKILHATNSKLNQATKKYFGLPKGSWIHSSRNYSMKGNVITVECANYSGNWIKNDVIIAPGVEYFNENGIMKCLPFTSYLDEEVFFTSAVLQETMKEHLNKKIFMTYKKNVPDKVFRRWKVLNPLYEIDFSLDAECIAFLEKTNGYLATLFKEIPVGMYKADLWRLCKLYANGGVYADVDLVPHLNLDYLDTDVTFYSCMSIFGNSIFQAFIVNHKPQSPLLYLMLLSFLLKNPQNNCIGPTFDMYSVLQYNIHEPIQTLKKYPLDSVKLEIKIGPSSVNEKRINLFYFPLENYDIQLKPNSYNDLFEFSVKNNILTVKRIDIDSGWGHDHSCELIVREREVVYLFKEVTGPNNNFSKSVVFDGDIKILDSRDMDYFHNGGW